MSTPERRVYLHKPEEFESAASLMKFRLTYEGPLRATQNDAREGQPVKHAKLKQAIRREFHGQLKRLWDTNRFLSEHRVYPAHYGLPARIAEGSIMDAPVKTAEELKIPLWMAMAELYREYDYRFVPLVREDWHLMCSLDILFLRRDFPGSVIQAGDLDNRIKTLIDALRRPSSQQELVEEDATPGGGEDPFYVLMEDDKQISHLSVEADTLFTPPTKTDDQSQVSLVITVELRTYNQTMFNLSLTGS